MIRTLALALAIFVASPVAAHADPDADWTPDTDWTWFMAQTHVRIGDPDWEDRLYRAGKEQANREAAMAAFASDLGVSRERADLFAAAIILSERIGDGCPAEHPCEFSRGSAAYDQIERAAAADSTGQLLVAIGENISSGHHEGRPARNAALVRLISGHPGRVKALAGLHHWNEETPGLAALVLAGPRDARTLDALRWSGGSPEGDPDVANGWMDAVLASAFDRLRAEGAPVSEQAVYVQVMLLRRLALGMTDEAVSFYLEQPPALQAALPLEAQECRTEYGEGRWPCMARAASDALTDELASALWLTGHRDEAGTLLARASDHLGPGLRTDAQRLAAITVAMQARRPAETLFDLYVDGDPAIPAAPNPSSFPSEGGWLSLDYGPASRRLVAARLRDAGYQAMADNITNRPFYFRKDPADQTLPLLTELFPADVRARQAAMAAAIEAAWARSPKSPWETRSPAQPVEIPPEWSEMPLPVGLAAWADDEEPAPLPADLAFPTETLAILRHEVVNGEHVILYLSSDYELPGETPAYGLWLARTERGRWTAPTYLGLQHYFPYVATRGSRLPLIADGQLQIEVRVREIAPRSVSFPPVGLSVARREDGIFISAPLAVIERDGDSDGLTDIAERRLGLDPDGADTDGDGLADGADPLPLTPYDPSTPATVTAFARAVIGILAEGAGPGNMLEPVPEDATTAQRLDAVIGSPPHPRLDTVIIQGDPALFAGLSPDFRLMVYDAGELDRLTKGAAPFYPPEMTIYSSLDGLDHYVIWSARWVGGSFTVRCPPDGGDCAVRQKSNWIT